MPKDLQVDDNQYQQEYEALSTPQKLNLTLSTSEITMDPDS